MVKSSILSTSFAAVVAVHALKAACSPGFLVHT